MFGRLLRTFTFGAMTMAALGCLALGSATASLLFLDGFEPDGDLFLDELRVRSVIADAPPSTPATEAMLGLVAANQGFPVRTAGGTYLFAANCGEETWALSGGFSDWKPAAMSRHGTLCWSEVAVHGAEEEQYVFVRPGPASFADPWARRYLYVDGAERSLVRAQAAHLQRWFGFGPAAGLLPRQLRIWVPEGAEFDRVIYMHDGQNLFDPEAIFGGWNVQAAVPPGVLVVGIDNSAERSFEYTHVAVDLGGGLIGGGADLYADLVQLHVRPFIARRYGEAPRHGLLGATLGGLISLHIAQRFPGQFAFAGSMSGTLGWGSSINDSMIQRYSAAGHGTTPIYLDSGGDSGACADNYCVTVEMRDTLLGLGYVAEGDLWYRWAPSAPGNETAWAARVSMPLGLFTELD
jgi:hypothetical protein